MPNNHTLSEEEVKLRFITPAITEIAKWDRDTQVRMEYYFTDGMVLVRDGVITKGKQKKADYLLSYNSIPLAIVEAKKQSCSVGDGMQQALEYAEILDIPFVYSSNGLGFLEHDRLAKSDPERYFGMGEFPSSETLFKRYCSEKSIGNSEAKGITVPYYYSDGIAPRYYQRIAINRTVEAVSTGVYPGGKDNRILLVMATGSGKTFTAFQIIYRLREAGLAKRILYLADRNVLIDQTISGDFKPFSKVMTKVKNKHMDSAFEIYMSLYQQQISEFEEDDTYKQFKPEFFDLIIVDECHRGSADERSNWRRILEYFSGAVQIGMTATPKETKEVSNIDYFGESLYTYSLKQGIEDGFLAPYKVVRVHIDKDLLGWRPESGQRDSIGKLIDDRIYNQKDFDRSLVIDERTKVVALRIAEYLKSLSGYPKTIVFCENIDHAERMRSALVNAIGGEAITNSRYVMRITGDNAVGKAQLENFSDADSQFPVIATTSDLMTTGVNCKTCQVIAIDKNINSATEFKQILGRGTRLYQRKDKYYFTLLDFRDVSRIFADPDFDGDPIQVKDGDDLPPKVLTKKNDGNSDKYRVNNVDVSILSEEVMYYSSEGKLTTEKITDFTRNTVLRHFSSIDEFLKIWSTHLKREVISNELELDSAFLDKIREIEGLNNMDDFDLLCHLAFNAKPLTKSERVKNVVRRGYLNKYSGKAREVLEILLEKYSSESDIDVSDLRVFKLSEFMSLGTPIQIGGLFGGADKLRGVLSDLKSELYSIEG